MRGSPAPAGEQRQAPSLAPRSPRADVAEHGTDQYCARVSRRELRLAFRSLPPGRGCADRRPASRAGRDRGGPRARSRLGRSGTRESCLAAGSGRPGRRPVRPSKRGPADPSSRAASASRLQMRGPSARQRRESIRACRAADRRLTMTSVGPSRRRQQPERVPSVPHLPGAGQAAPRAEEGEHHVAAAQRGQRDRVARSGPPTGNRGRASPRAPRSPGRAGPADCRVRSLVAAPLEHMDQRPPPRPRGPAPRR